MDKKTGTKDVDTSEKKLSQVPQPSWSAARKSQLDLIREVEAMRKKKRNGEAAVQGHVQQIEALTPHKLEPRNDDEDTR